MAAAVVVSEAWIVPEAWSEAWRVTVEVTVIVDSSSLAFSVGKMPGV